MSLPSFWLALLILMAFVSYLGGIPIYTDPPDKYMGGAGALYLIPAAAVGFRGLGA